MGKDVLTERLIELRANQDVLNLQIAELLVKRLRISQEILALKRDLSLFAYSEAREREIVSLVTSRTDLSQEESSYLASCFLEFCRLSREAQGSSLPIQGP